MQRVIVWAAPAAAAGVLLAVSTALGRPASNPALQHLNSALFLGPLLVSGALLSWRSAADRWTTCAWLHTVHAVVGYAVLSLALVVGAVATSLVMLYMTHPSLLGPSADLLAVSTAAAVGGRALWRQAGALPRSASA